MQVVSALGPRFGEEGSSSEAVDFKGVQSAIEAAEAFLAPGSSTGDEEKSLIVPKDGSSGAGGPGGENCRCRLAGGPGGESCRCRAPREPVALIRGSRVDKRDLRTLLVFTQTFVVSPALPVSVGRNSHRSRWGGSALPSCSTAPYRFVFPRMCAVLRLKACGSPWMT